MDVGLAKSLLDAIDAFLVSIHSVATGAMRSAYVAAALHEELRGVGNAPPVFGAVVFVKAASGSVSQVFTDRIFSRGRF